MQRTPARPHGYTLVELMIGMSLASVLMLGVLSTYLFLGRGNTRLSYQHALEIEARTIVNTLALDVRNTKYITNASSTGLTLQLIDGTTVTYNYTSTDLTRDPGSGAVSLTNDIKGEKVQVAVTMPVCTINYYTTSDGSPTYQATATIVPLSIKQMGLNFTLRAGTAGIQDKSGTMTTFQMASGWLLFRNKQLPNGT
jgi:prepilin-type N-terminal cleavage/methylation domain-containing protein